jgi:Cof subfamily protein (haloacid dehalogenase superfamily)
MIKLFVSDIDGTIFDHTVGVPRENIEALLKLQKKGVKLVLASGRAVPAMMGIANQLNLKSNSGYIIASNGAEVYDLAKDEYIHQVLISKELTREIYQFSIENNLYFSCVQKDVLFYSYYDQAIEHEKYHGDFKIKHIKHSNDIKLDSSKCSVNIEIDGNLSAMDDFIKRFESKVSVERLLPWYMDIQSKEQSKRLGLEKLCERLSIDLKDVAAIGDGTNDKSMLEIVGISASLEQSHESILSIVDHIMPSAKDAGVAHFVELILKNNAL